MEWCDAVTSVNLQTKRMRETLGGWGVNKMSMQAREGDGVFKLFEIDKLVSKVISESTELQM